MKKSLLTIIIIFVCILSFSAFKPVGDWKLFTSKEGGFSIEFPGQPEISVQQDTSEAGVPFLINFASFEASDNEVYMAGWIDMKNIYPEGKTLQQILEDSRDGATTSMNATEVKTLATVTTGDPYIEFTFVSSNFVGKDRIYIINKVQYSIISIFTSETGIKPSADKFIGSFKNIQGQ
ncbi:MAG: hypothetical protein HXX13_14750 [Bacteroidetes bacterium]|nr:hypothetical protein [Bacteroidota bacterium]